MHLTINLIGKQFGDGFMATIKDVAERAGVSKTLVSRYLNNQKGVSPVSREKITEAIKALNYRPNGLARSLVLQETQTIGIVLDNLGSPFVSRLISGFEKGAEDYDRENKYSILFCSANGDIKKKQSHIKFLTQGRVDGIIIYGSLISDDTIIEELSHSTFPFLLIENDAAGIDANKIVIDNTGGAYLATEYLIKAGFKKIAHIAGNMNLKITLDRMNGFVRALQDYKIPIDRNMIVYPEFPVKSPEHIHSGSDRTYFDVGYAEMKKMIDQKNIPEAIFFATDISAFGAIKALNEAGLSVPGDVSIIGFDDERPCDYECDFKPISTLRQPLEEAGYIGIKTLIKNVKDINRPKERIILKPEFIIRDSCKKI